MASDSGQPKTGFYTATPHVILETMALDMEKAELRLTAALLRNTYGWKRRECNFNKSKLRELTHLSKQGIYDALKAVEKRGFFALEDSGVVVTFKCLPVKSLDPNLEQASNDWTDDLQSTPKQPVKSVDREAVASQVIRPFESNHLTPVGVNSGVLKIELKKRESGRDLQHGAEPKDSFALSEEQEEKDGLPIVRTKPKVLNTAFDPLYSALDELCEGRGTGGAAFMQALKELNAAGLFACDLDDMAERIRKQYGFDRLSAGNFKGYLTFYLSQREHEEEIRQKEAADLAYTEQYYREQAILEAERDRKAAIDTELRKQARLAREKAEWEEVCAKRRDRLRRMAVPETHPLWSEYRTAADPVFNKAMVPFELIYLERTDETYPLSAGAN